MPQVSVILPVKDGGPSLRVAVGSILNQTFRDLELIVVDDGSVIPASDWVFGIRDRRLRFVRNATSLGVAGACRLGVSLARGDLIARQDHDDVAYPTRIDRQVEFLTNHVDVGLVGTRARIVSDRQPVTVLGIHSHPSDDLAIRVHMLWNNPFVHSTVVMRRRAYEQAGGYLPPPVGRTPEDFDLWSRVAQDWRVANLPDVLLDYVQRDAGESRLKSEEIQSGADRIAADNLRLAAGLGVLDPGALGLAQRLNGRSPHAIRALPGDAALLRRATSGLAQGHLSAKSHALTAAWARFAAGTLRSVVARQQARRDHRTGSISSRCGGMHPQSDTHS